MPKEHEVGTEGDLEPGSLKRVDVLGVPICLARTVDGCYFAIHDHCTHEQASLSEGWLDGHHVECSLHNAIFDLKTGDPLSLPAEEKVRVFPITLRNSKVFIEL